MEYITPELKGFTIYSKSGCINCTSVKRIIKEHKNFLCKEIDCDEYLLEDREGFLSFIEKNAETSYKTFPMVFYDGKFIGGFAHTKEFIDKLLSFEDNL